MSAEMVTNPEELLPEGAAAEMGSFPETTGLQHETVDEFLEKNCSVKEPEFILPIEDAKAAVEAILFASGDPVPLDKMASVLGYEKDKTLKILTDMIEEYRFDLKRGITVRQLNDSFTLSTKAELNPILQRLFLPRNRPPMTQAAYETLAIIAYNQPVTRSQVEAVRGVSSDSIIARLLEKNLIQECGSLDAPGRPTLFETSELFLKEFGLSSVKDLPPMDMMMYGTLRDIETSLNDTAGARKDNQITIEQFVETIIPKQEGGVISGGDETIDSGEIISLSSAFFGEPQE